MASATEDLAREALMWMIVHGCMMARPGYATSLFYCLVICINQGNNYPSSEICVPFRNLHSCRTLPGPAIRLCSMPLILRQSLRCLAYKHQPRHAYYQGRALRRSIYRTRSFINVKRFHQPIRLAFCSKQDVNSLVHAPFTLAPSPFPREEFEKAVRIQQYVDQLVHNISMDYDFLQTTLAGYGEHCCLRRVHSLC